MRDQTIGIVGFGNQGRSWALNLRDSGWNVHLFLRPDSSSRKKAQDLGFHLLNPQSLREMPVLAMLLPDDAMPI
ncbi:MAG: hypothetical protein KDD48_08900, partial [Bdellovibrionales bacterium]|nr:hypothetical protein [Bdellovibrionales bacterium]